MFYPAEIPVSIFHLLFLLRHSHMDLPALTYLFLFLNFSTYPCICYCNIVSLGPSDVLNLLGSLLFLLPSLKHLNFLLLPEFHLTLHPLFFLSISLLSKTNNKICQLSLNMLYPIRVPGLFCLSQDVL